MMPIQVSTMRMSAIEGGLLHPDVVVEVDEAEGDDDEGGEEEAEGDAPHVGGEGGDEVQRAVEGGAVEAGVGRELGHGAGAAGDGDDGKVHHLNGLDDERQVGDGERELVEEAR